MPEPTRSVGLASADAESPRGRRPIRSIVHRMAGEPLALPIEGRLASFDGATGWLNSHPLTPDALRGRVVLVNFWTYTCVNWIRTLPYVRAWAAKYSGAGLVVVGVHTPEFGFERYVDNVVAAARTFDVSYPIALDGEYEIWGAFGNRYWPATYVADVDGRIRHHHFGEGEYAETEMVIQQLLLDAGAGPVDQDVVMVEPRGLEVAADWRTIGSPETYTGYRQSSGFAQEDRARFDEAHSYAAPERLAVNSWALTGNWTVAPHAAISNDGAGRVAFQFHARDLNLVMGPARKGAVISFRVLLDGQPAHGAYGTDLQPDGRGLVGDHRTYQLIRQAGPIASRRFEIEFADAGVEVFCFTFG